MIRGWIRVGVAFRRCFPTLCGGINLPIGSFFIPSAVKAGKFVDIEGKDVSELYRLAGLMPPSDSPSSAKAGPRLSKAGKRSAR